MWVPSGAQCHLLEVGVFVFLLYMGVAALLREDINLFDTANHRQNPQVTTSLTQLDVLININAFHCCVHVDVEVLVVW